MLGKRRGNAFWTRAVLALVLVLLIPEDARAYPWMIRHGYVGCNACHVDPSGSGALTGYGRMIGDSGLRTRADDDNEAGRAGEFLFGLAPTEDWLALGGDVRLLFYRTKVEESPLVAKTIWMQADLEATITHSRVVASGSIGYAPEGALGAALTRGTDGNVVSRQHWLGYRLDEPVSLMVRLGRMNLPFGIRTIEHTLGVRHLTATNINDQQQYGAAVFLGTDRFRGELMAIAGNYQLRPDDYRERGYSLYGEWSPSEQIAFGASSLITHRSRDTLKLKETWRHAHGVFARVAPGWEPLVLQSEWDYVLVSSKDEFHRSGVVSYLQADLEFHQGMHVLITGEANNVGARDRFWNFSGWLSYAWFFGPHTDLRLDIIQQSLGSSFGRLGVTSVLLQGHIYL